MLRKQKIKVLLITAFCTVLLAQCTPGRFPLVQPLPSFPEVSAAKSKAEEYFIRARDYDRRGISQMAEHYYEMASELDPNSMVLKEAIVGKYLDEGKNTQALLLVKGNKKLSELTREEKKMTASIYLKLGEFAKAADALEAIQDRDQEETISLGLIYETLGNTSKALKRYLEYFRLNPVSMELGIKIGQFMIAEKQLDSAEQFTNSLATLFGESAELYSLSGAVHIAKHDTTGALEKFEKARGLDSLNEDAIKGIAQIYLARNDFTNAIPCYDVLRKISYYSDIYARTLAILYYYNGQYEQSETLLTGLIQSNMDDGELHYYLGLIFESTDRMDLGRLEIQKAVQIQPALEEAWRELCYIDLREENYDSAFSSAVEFVRIDSVSAGSWRLLGYVNSIRKHYDAAADAFKKAAVYDSANAGIWFDLASAYERGKKYDKASSAFGRVLDLKPGDAPTCNYLGYMWAEHSMKLDSAKVLIEKALKKDSSNGAYLDSYAWVYFQLGDISKAFEYIQQAISHIDSDPVVYSHYGDILSKKGDRSGALSAYRKCIDFNADDSDMIRKKILELEAVDQIEKVMH